MTIKRYGTDFKSEGGALTLRQEAVTDLDNPDTDVIDPRTYSRTHERGWTITGKPQYDYCLWVNRFVARHPRLGMVWGNFEEEVHASSEEAFAHFWKHHEPEAWSYHDI